MSKIPVSKADGLNTAEKNGHSLEDLMGGKPGIRKRSYYRGLKRGAHWAYHKKTMQDLMTRMNRDLFSMLANPIVDENVPVDKIYTLSMSGLSEIVKGIKNDS